jgi:trigger factor
VKSNVAPLEGNKVKLSVEVDEAEFDKALDAAFRKIAREVRINGFRPGKAPRRVLEGYVGMAPAREQALRDAIPEYLARAVREHDVDIIAPPDVDITGGQDDGPVQFDATIQVRPQVTVPGYAGLRVELPSPTPSDEEIDGQLKRMQQPFAEMQPVERTIRREDVVTIDLVGRRPDREEPFVDRQDLSYEVGANNLAEELDENLEGKSAGDVFTYTVDHPHHDHPALEYDVTVKSVQEKVYPAMDDEWAKEASEFESFDELRADLVKRMTMVRAMQAQIALREQTADALAKLVDDEAPDILVEEETRRRAQELVQQLQARGLTVEQYFLITGRTPEELTEELKSSATLAVKADLALRSVADAESITADDDDVEAEYERIARRQNVKPKDVRKAYERNDAVPELKAEIRKRKALDWLVERVEIVDPDGRIIDRSELEFRGLADDVDPDLLDEEFELVDADE